MKYRINLLPIKEKKITDRVIYFSLHYLRYILVITQIVVIGVFFYRFKIDQEIIDLKEELTQKQEIVLVSDPLLKEAQASDIKIKEIKQIIGKQEIFKNMVTYFLNIFPQELSIERLKINNDSLEFEAIGSNPKIIRIFLEKLKKDRKFNQVELGSIKKIENNFNAPFILKGYINNK